MAEAISTQEVREFLEKADIKCGFCGRKLAGRPVEHYSHDGGVRLKGFKDRRWVFVNCQCGYDWSLWKLLNDLHMGYSRGSEERILKEIHRSNMTKDPPTTHDGKAVKGPNYQPPNLKPIIERLRSRWRTV